jgi:hypothetical protein
MRLVTRGDLDGLTCAVLISTCEPIDEILLIHPQDITDRTVTITSKDILANLPYHPSCGMWFDHHLLTESNTQPPKSFDGRYGLAPSAASMVWEYYRGHERAIGEFDRYEKLLQETDRLDSAQLTMDDVLEPKGYVLLGLTLDPRTGLGTFEEYFRLLLEALRKLSLDEVLALPEVVTRVARMREQDERFRGATTAHSHVDGNVIVTDFRPLDSVPVGNRFIVYTLFPQANISLRIHWGPRREKVVLAVGHSIFRRSSRTNVGELMSRYNGGGHRGAGTCVVPTEKADQIISEMVTAMKKDG